MEPETAKFMLELSDDIDRLWKYLGQDQEAKELREKARDIKGKVDAYKKEAEDLFRKQYEESTRYFNTVMAIGYAGYFAAWTLTKDHLDKWHASFVGLMGLTSLALFICWELFSMQMRMKVLQELDSFFRNMISVDDFEQLRERQLRIESRRMMFLRPIWAVVFTASTFTAAAGAFDMMIRLYLNL